MARNRRGRRTVVDRLDKIMPQEGLRAFMTGSTDETMRVIIEPQVVEPRIVVRAADGKMNNEGRLASVLAVRGLSARQQREVQGRLTRVRERLLALGVKRPVTLHAAQAIAAKLTAEQMRSVAAYPEVARIVC